MHLSQSVLVDEIHDIMQAYVKQFRGYSSVGRAARLHREGSLVQTQLPLPFLPVSSSGRTAGFHPANWGSIPHAGANLGPIAQ